MALYAQIHRRVQRQVLVVGGAVQLMTTQTGHRLAGPSIDNILADRVGRLVCAGMARLAQVDIQTLQQKRVLGSVRLVTSGTGL